MASVPSSKTSVIRRSWPLAEKRRIVELTLQPGASVQSVARKYRLDPPTLSAWRTLYRNGHLNNAPKNSTVKNAPLKFLPVTIEETPMIASSGSMVVGISFPNGITVQIETGNRDLSGLNSLFSELRK